MHELQSKGTRAIQLDVLTIEHKLSQRQKQALEYLGEKGEEFSIQDYELLCPEINRRSLQRDLSDLISKGLITQSGMKKTTRYRINLDQ